MNVFEALIRACIRYSPEASVDISSNCVPGVIELKRRIKINSDIPVEILFTPQKPGVRVFSDCEDDAQSISFIVENKEDITVLFCKTTGEVKARLKVSLNEADALTVETTSGDILAKGLKVIDLCAKSKSGDVNLLIQKLTKGKVQTESGEISIKLLDKKISVDLETRHGSVAYKPISVLKNTGYIKCESESGDIIVS